MSADPENNGDDSKGIRCPKCNCADLRTTNTIRLHGNRIRRYKRCRHCGRRIVTTETTPNN